MYSEGKPELELKLYGDKKEGFAAKLLPDIEIEVREEYAMYARFYGAVDGFIFAFFLI